MLNKLYNVRFYHGEFLLLITLALFGMDFMLHGIILLILYGVVFCVNNKTLSSRYIGGILAFFFAFVLFYIMSSRFEAAILKNVIAVLVAALIGCKIKGCTAEKICFYIVFIALFMALHAMMNMAYNYSQLGVLAIAERTAYDFWTQDISAATGQASKLTPFIACSFYLIFYNKNTYLRLLSVILLFATVIFDLGLAGRSALVLLLFSIVLSYFIGSMRAKKVSSSAKVLVFVGLAVVALFFAYSIDLFGIQEIFEESSFNQRFNSPSGQDIDEDDRTRRKLIFLSHLLDYPFGGQHLCYDLKVGHAHDLWLDTFDMAGLLPLLLLVGYTLASIYRAYRFYNRPVNPYIATLVLVFFIIMNIQFYLEPIIEGSPKLLIFYCLIDSMVSRYLSQKTLLNFK